MLLLRKKKGSRACPLQLERLIEFFFLLLLDNRSKEMTMTHPDAIELLRQQTTAAKEAHLAELDAALTVQVSSIRSKVPQELVTGFVDAMLDAKWRARMRSLVSQPPADTAQGIAHVYHVLDELLSPLADVLSKSLSNVAKACHVVAAGHFTDHIIPRLEEQYSKVLSDEQHRLAEQLNRRVKFFEADHETKMAMMANHEVKSLSPYLTALLHSAQGGGGGAAGTETGSFQGRIFERDAFSLARLEHEVEAKMNQSVLQRMTAERAKTLLLESHDREAKLWAELEHIQQILHHNAQEEEKERQIFRAEVQAATEKEVRELHAKVNSLSADLKNENDEKRIVEQQREEVIGVLQQMDGWAIKLATELTYLVEVARQRDCLTEEFERVENELFKVGERYRATALAKDQRWLVDRLRVNPATLPTVQGSREQQRMLELQKTITTSRHEVDRYKAKMEDLEKQVAEERKRQLQMEFAATKDQRQLHHRMSEAANAVRKENHVLRSKQRELEADDARLRETHVAVRADTLAYDLARKLKWFQHRQGQLEAELLAHCIPFPASTPLPPSDNADAKTTDSPLGDGARSERQQSDMDADPKAPEVPRLKIPSEWIEAGTVPQPKPSPFAFPTRSSRVGDASGAAARSARTTYRRTMHSIYNQADDRDLLQRPHSARAPHRVQLKAAQAAMARHTPRPPSASNRK